MKKVLFIDDDNKVLEIYQEIFKTADLTVITALTGKEGLALALSEKPDLIILDVMLPGGLNGFDVLKQLKINPGTKSVPVIILTNLDSEEKTATDLGAAKYLIKANTTTTKLIETVKNVLAKSEEFSSK